MIKRIFLFVILWRLLLFFLSFIGVFYIPINRPFLALKDFGMHMPYFVWIWGNFDGNHYLEIARFGYRTFTVPFFPLYPLLIRWSYIIFHFPYIISGQIISSVSFLLSLLVIYKTLKLDIGKESILFTIILLLFFPTSFFYISVYPDSLFLLLSTSSICFARKKKWVLSSFLGGLATLCRLNGLAIFFFILIEYLSTGSEKCQWHSVFFVKRFNKAFSKQAIIRSKIYSVFLIPFSFISYLFYIHVSYGSWKILFSSMSIWSQSRPVFPPQVFWRYAKLLSMERFDQFFYWVVVLELFFVLFYIYIVVYSYKKIRISYWFFIVISFLVPTATGTFQGMPRYALHLYPFFLATSLMLQKIPFYSRILYYFLSLVLLILLVDLFTRGYFIA